MVKSVTFEVNLDGKGFEDLKCDIHSKKITQNSLKLGARHKMKKENIEK